MADKIIVSKSKVTNLFDSIRAKSGSTDLMSFDVAKSTVDDIQTGSKLNIHYSSTEAPEDTSQLWVKADINPSKVSVSCSNLPTISGDGTLETLTTKLSKQLKEAICGVVGKKCYIFGGAGNNAILRYDTETDTVTTLSAPGSSSISACGVVGKKIYLFASDTIQCYDTESDTITTLSTKLSQKAQYLTCGVVGKKCYIFGGYASPNLKIIQCYDTETDTVTTLSATLSQGLFGMACGVVGTKIYLCGGRTHLNGGINIIQCYDTETDTLTTLSTTLLEAMWFIACGVVGKKIYLFSGVDSGRYVKPQIQCYDTETDTVTILSITIPDLTNKMTCGVVGTKCYLFGGEWYDSKSYTYKTADSIMVFTAGGGFILSYHYMFLKITLKEPYFNLISSENININIGIGKCYLGNKNNEAIEQTVAIHNGTEWQEI